MHQWAQQYNGGQYIYPASTPCMNSTFSYPKSGLYDYSDAEWLVGYNGTCHGYFVSWSQPGYLDQWHINYPDSTSCPNATHPEANWNYVGRVCGTVPY